MIRWLRDQATRGADALLEWQDSHRRHADMNVLWPTIRGNAENIEQARNAFTLHCQLDHAWRRVDKDEIYRIVEGLS